MVVEFGLHGAEDVVRQGVSAKRSVLRYEPQKIKIAAGSKMKQLNRTRGNTDLHMWWQLKKVHTHVGIHLLLAVDI